MEKLAIFLTILSALALTACQQTENPKFETYNSELYSVIYPNNFTLEEDNSLGVVKISNEKGRIEIGDVEFGVSPGPQPGMTQEQIDQFPKEIITHGYNMDFESALFYKTGDTETAAKLKEIQDSIKLTNEISREDSWRNIVKYNCEQSGGSFKNDKCECPIEEQLGQTSESMYDKNRGYCQTTVGGDGGEVGLAAEQCYGYKLDLEECKKK